MALIFGGSTDLLSARHTSRFVEPFLRWLSRGTLSAQRIEEIHFLIRKTGHLCEYAVLCALLWWALRPAKDALIEVETPTITARRQWRRAALAVLIAAGFAASDEFHQSFVPSRGASVADVLIDTAGAATGLLSGLALRQTIRSRLRPHKR